jgi:hypothetical protein
LYACPLKSFMDIADEVSSVVKVKDHARSRGIRCRCSDKPEVGQHLVASASRDRQSSAWCSDLPRGSQAVGNVIYRLAFPGG